MSDTMIWKLANAFGYDIDFAQDLREGDSFSVIYDDVYREGEHMHDGDIIAATFINQGKRYTAIRYTNADGEMAYYSEDGRPLRKAFLRTPVEFTRISSVFSVGRMHPILGYMRAHKGVDYAAPTGTPIRAAGDGKITFRGWSSGYGNFVTIQHNGHISHRVRPHVRVREREARPAREPGPDHRLRRHDRPCDRPASALRIPRRRPASRSADRHAAEGRAAAADAARALQAEERPLLAKLKFVDGMQLARAND